MPTPRDLRELADRADASAAEAEEQAARVRLAAEGQAGGLEEQAAVLRRQAIELRRLAAAQDEGLKSMHPEGTVSVPRMEARSAASAGAKKAWAKIQNRWPLQVALFRRGRSVPEWARAQKSPALEVETAKSWLKKKGHGGHRVPQEWAERIAREFGEVDKKGRLVSSEVPAVDASWPCGIRRPTQ